MSKPCVKKTDDKNDDDDDAPNSVLIICHKTVNTRKD